MPAEIELIKQEQVVFVVDTPRGTYRDAFYYPVGAKPSDEVIRANAQARADAWLVVVDTPPVEEPSPEPEFEVVCEDGVVLYV